MTQCVTVYICLYVFFLFCYVVTLLGITLFAVGVLLPQPITTHRWHIGSPNAITHVLLLSLCEGVSFVFCVYKPQPTNCICTQSTVCHCGLGHTSQVGEINTHDHKDGTCNMKFSHPLQSHLIINVVKVNLIFSNIRSTQTEKDQVDS